MGVLAGGVWFRVVRAVVIIPAYVDASVLYSAVLNGFDAGVVRPLQAFGELNSCELGVFQFQFFLILLLLSTVSCLPSESATHRLKYLFEFRSAQVVSLLAVICVIR